MISAAILSYPVVDILNASGFALPGFPDWFARVICRNLSPSRDRAWLLSNACPSAVVGSAPDDAIVAPMLIIHGADDNVVGKGTVRHFVELSRAKLGASAKGDVAYLEVPHAHHGFDTFGNLKTSLVSRAAAIFLEKQWQGREKGEKSLFRSNFEVHFTNDASFAEEGDAFETLRGINASPLQFAVC
ncbi:hypothetical protein HKX48_008132 [Thoreauomyces humboldtii]|nr:hypothetical protein HKX48_008132 [Thoreauomyces humboldtii]